MTMSLADRAVLAYQALLLRDEQKWAKYGFGITDSDVLEMVEDNTTGSCYTKDSNKFCTSDGCCDYQRLSILVWSLVESSTTGEEAQA